MYPCFDPYRFLKSTLSELFGNGNVDIETGVRNDNSGDLEHVHSVNSVAKGLTTNGLLESNSEGLDINDLLTLSHITGGLGISDEMAKTTTQNKLLTLSPSDISQTASKK